MRIFKKLFIINLIIIIVLASTGHLFINTYANSPNMRKYSSYFWNPGYSDNVLWEAIQETQPTGDFKPDASNGNIWVRYNWLHATKDVIDATYGNSYKEIAKQSDEKDISKAIEFLLKAKTEIGTFVVGDDEIDDGEVKWDWQIYIPIVGVVGEDVDENVTGTPRSAQAFQNITGLNMYGCSKEKYRNADFKKKIDAQFDIFEEQINTAIRTLHRARDTKAGKTSSSSDIFIDHGYKTKFLYTLQEVKAYDVFYDTTYTGGNLTVNESNQIAKVWKIKALAEAAGHARVANTKEVYVRKKDDKATKQKYDKDQIWLYIQLFGTDAGLTEKEENELWVKWANKLIGKNQFDAKNDGSIKAAKEYLEEEKVSESDLKKAGDAIKNNTDGINNITSNHKYDSELKSEGGDKKIDKDASRTFYMPENLTKVEGGGINDVVNDANNFVTASNKTMQVVNEKSLSEFSKNIYNILFSIGIVIAVIVGLILGIKLMLAPIGERADAKKLLVPYAVGCAVVFGAFGIWKLVVVLMQNV